MFRITSISLAALVSIGVASAGQFQIGGVNGLTNTYVTSGVGSTDGGAASESNYNNVLFSHTSNGVSTPLAYSTYNQTAGEKGTITDGAVTFAMINDGVTGSGNSKNYWSVSQGGTPANFITVPIGIYGVADVWTMINTDLATFASGQDVTLMFNFGTTANASTVDSVKVLLNDSTNSTTATGETRNAVDCNPVTTDPCGSTANANPSSGPVLSSTILTPTSGATGTVSFSSHNLYTFAGTTGNVNLDDQGFLFNSLNLTGAGFSGDTNLNTYLVSVTIREAGNLDTNATLGLSAITVDSDPPVPEPSTVVLFLAGLGAVGFGKFRRRKA